MAATAAAVVAEEDTELRDLLVQTLGVAEPGHIKVRRGPGKLAGGRRAALAAEAVWTPASQGARGRDGRARPELGSGPPALGGVGGSVTGSPRRCGCERTKGPSRL